jgi:hypothetical protein
MSEEFYWERAREGNAKVFPPSLLSHWHDQLVGVNVGMNVGMNVDRGALGASVVSDCRLQTKFQTTPNLLDS